MKKMALVVLVVCTGLGLGGYKLYASFQRARAAADVAIADIHRHYNAGELAAIYTAADAGLRRASSEKDFTELMGAMTRKLGKVTKTEGGPLNIRTMNATTTMVAVHTTTFEHGRGTETFTFEYSGERPVLLGYNISSRELIVK